MFSIGPIVSYDTLNIFYGFPPITFVVCFVWVPESPYYLLNDSDETDNELTAMKNNVDEDMQAKGSYLELLSIYSNRKAVTIVMVTCACQRLCGTSSLLNYSSTTLPPSSGLPILGQNQVIMIFGLLLMLANFIATPLVDSLGRKPLLLISRLGTGLCTATSGFYYLSVPARDSQEWIPYSALLVFGLFQAIGLGVIPLTLLFELFPSNIKAKAAAISSIVLALSSFSTNKTYIPVEHTLGIHYMFFFFSLSSFSAFIFTIFFVFETKGKTFPEIQDRLKGK